MNPYVGYLRRQMMAAAAVAENLIALSDVGKSGPFGEIPRMAQFNGIGWPSPRDPEPVPQRTAQ